MQFHQVFQEQQRLTNNNNASINITQTQDGNPFASQSMVSPVRRNTATKNEGSEVTKIKKENEELTVKLKEAETKLKKDNDFYQDALQKRFEQMEQFQEKSEELET